MFVFSVYTVYAMKIFHVNFACNYSKQNKEYFYNKLEDFGIAHM